MTSVHDQARQDAASQVFAGGGEMGALMRALDWAATPLGPVERWSPSLCTMVRVLLANRFPLLLWWGPEHCQLYNDAYRPVLGAKHPRSLGQPAAQCWPEIWHIIGPLIETPYTGGPPTWDDDLFLEIHRHGFVEETHFTVAYSPVPDDTAPGDIGGVLATVHEITQQVIQERRLAVLRDLGARASDAKTAEEACAIAATALELHPRDVPFALLYLVDAEQQRVRLAATAGVPADADPGPLDVNLAAEDQSEATRPLAAVLRTEEPRVVENLPARFGRVPPGPWSDPPERALVLPLPSSTPHRPAGLLVLGLSPRLALDEAYRSFGVLVAGQIGTAVVNARAYEEERRRAEALAELDRAKTAFFSNVSHEFRTPLTLLLGPLADVLAAPPETPLGAERTPIEIAQRNALRLLRLVNTLLDFARIEAGRAEASFEPTDLAALTAELAGVFRSAVERAGLRLEVNCPPLPRPVYVDHEMWEKVVLNLLSNAFKFTFAGTIIVALNAVDDHVELTVRDTGVGIPPEELPHLFERFHRVRGARARTHEGTGIGLALVKELVALHGGAIEVESALDVGTTVTVTLPLGTAHLPAESIGATRTQASTALGAAPFVEEALRWLPDPETTETVEAEGLLPDVATPPGMEAPDARIVLADDNADMRDYLRRTLGARYYVEAVSNGAEALAAARAQPPDLVLADVMMPGLDGFALLQALRADPRTRTVPVMLLSARAGQEAIAEGLRAGADDYMVKPFSANELLARVQAHMALARLRQEAGDALAAERDRLQAEVAARAQAEEALRRSHEQLRLALTAARMVAWEWDPHADAITTSENLPDVYGVARLDSSAEGFPLVHPGDRARHEALVRQAVENAGGYESTFRITRPDTGETVWLEERAAAIVDDEGELRKLTGVVVDISARVQTEAEMRRQVALLTLAHDAIIVRDPHGTIITWNDGAAALYGWTSAEAVGQTTHTLLRTRMHDSDTPGTEVDVALTERGAWEGELVHVRRDGSRVVVESRQALLRAADGTPEAILEVNRDIAPRLELTAALAQLQTLQAVSDAALSQLALPALLRQVLERITAALAADNTAILLLDETENALIVHHAVGPEEAQTGQMRVPVGQGVAGRIAATRQPLVLADLRTVEPVNPLLREQMASLMGVPLLVEDRLIGVMHVDSATPRQFSDDELHLLQLVADRVALALDNARLYRNALEARDQVTRLQGVTAALSAAATVEQVADVIIAHGLEALGASAGVVALLTADGAAFTTARAAGYPSEVIGAWSTFSAADANPIADAARTREPILLETRAAHDARYPHLATIHSRDSDGALAAFPLLLGERAIGGLGLSFTQPRQFDAEDRAVIGALAELCTQALERARLYEAAQRARGASEAERDRWRQVLDALPVGVVIVDAQGRVEVLNQAGRKIIGLDTRGQPLPSAGDEDRDEYRVRRPDGTPYPPEEVPLSRSLRHGEEVRGDQQLHRHAVTGRETPLLVNSAPLRDADGTITGAVAVFQDITELRELERTREEFLSSAAHDLKTPLTSIRGQAQLAQRRLDRLGGTAMRPVAEQLTGIQERVDAMVDLVDELVDVTRMEMGSTLELRRAPTDLLALVRRCVEAQRAASGRVIHLEAEATELVADVDAARLERVVGNLLSNAVKYSPGGGTITVRVARETGVGGPQALIAVRDEGMGIPAADLPHIFERFARGRNVAGHIQGTGIGLASARGIVEQHGGTITAVSVEGQGATFTVRLPLATA